MADVRSICALVAFLVPLCVFVHGQQQQLQQPLGPTEICLGCICEAVSNCDRSLRCTGDVCGIFRITWAYWSDAGKPTLQGDDPQSAQAYPNCVNDPVCAGKTVTGYMTKYAQDCDGDGVVTCFDHAKIHRLGGYGCTGPLDEAYKNKFLNCQIQVMNLTNGHF